MIALHVAIESKSACDVLTAGVKDRWICGSLSLSADRCGGGVEDDSLSIPCSDCDPVEGLIHSKSPPSDYLYSLRVGISNNSQKWLTSTWIWILDLSLFPPKQLP